MPARGIQVGQGAGAGGGGGAGAGEGGKEQELGEGNHDQGNEEGKHFFIGTFSGTFSLLLFYVPCIFQVLSRYFPRPFPVFSEQSSDTFDVLSWHFPWTIPLHSQYCLLLSWYFSVEFPVLSLYLPCTFQVLSFIFLADIRVPKLKLLLKDKVQPGPCEVLDDSLPQEYLKCCHALKVRAKSWTEYSIHLYIVFWNCLIG